MHRAENPTKTQHRPKRDTAHAKEIQDLKSDIKGLKKQVLRLRRENQRLLESSVVFVPKDDDQTLSNPADVGNLCPTCSSQLAVVAMPFGTLHACKNCTFRRVVRRAT